MLCHLVSRVPSHAYLVRRIAIVAVAGLGACAQDQSPADRISASIEGRNLGGRAGLALTLRDSSLLVSDTVTLYVDGAAPPRADRRQATYVFRSSDSTTVSIDASGIVTAKRVGRATLSARSVLSSGSIDVTVQAGVSQQPQPVPPAPPPPETALPPFVAPQLPLSTVNVAPPATPTRTVRVPAGDAPALQRALNSAAAGDEIVLADGAAYAGSFHLPNRADGGTVVLRSETVPVGARTRITPGTASRLATLVTNSVAPALMTDDGAHGWRVIAVAMRLADGTSDNYGVVTIGSGIETASAQFARDIVLDRIAVWGSPTGGTSRCVSMNGIRLAVVDSWLAECHSLGRDAQAIAGWTGTGPFLIENNHLEGSGQAIMFGGSDPRIANVTPADITIRRNHLFKPLSWFGRWTVKAAFELKHAERVLFEANVIENHWTDAQVGYAILLQAASQDNLAPWTVVRDITMRLNVIRNSRSGVNLLAQVAQPGTQLQPARRILVRDNSFETVGRDPLSGAPGRFVQLLQNLEDVTVIQNTFYGTGASNAVLFDGAPTVRLVLSNNVFGAATYGIIGSGAGEGAQTLAQFAPGGVVRGNVLPGNLERLYPVGNVFPATLGLASFIDAANGNYTLRPETGFSILSGARTGVDGSAVLNATAGVTVR
jgi:hypothetical protein